MDPIADMFVRIINGYRAKKEVVILPHSRLKGALADILLSKGLIAGVEKKGKKVRKTLDVTLKYDASGRPVIQGVKRVSKPGRRLYRSAREIIPVRYGHGTLILSTPKGILTGKEAKALG